MSAVGDQLSVVAIAALVIDAGHGAAGLGFVLAARTLGLVVMIRPAASSAIAPGALA